MGRPRVNERVDEVVNRTLGVLNGLLKKRDELKAALCGGAEVHRKRITKLVAATRRWTRLLDPGDCADIGKLQERGLLVSMHNGRKKKIWCGEPIRSGGLVYAFRDFAGRFYIGSTINAFQRFAQHLKNHSINQLLIIRVLLGENGEREARLVETALIRIFQPELNTIGVDTDEGDAGVSTIGSVVGTEKKKRCRKRPPQWIRERAMEGMDTKVLLGAVPLHVMKNRFDILRVGMKDNERPVGFAPPVETRLRVFLVLCSTSGDSTTSISTSGDSTALLHRWSKAAGRPWGRWTQDCGRVCWWSCTVKQEEVVWWFGMFLMPRNIVLIGWMVFMLYRLARLESRLDGLYGVCCVRGYSCADRGEVEGDGDRGELRESCSR